jgi:hypothetical protein
MEACEPCQEKAHPGDWGGRREKAGGGWLLGIHLDAKRLEFRRFQRV